MAAFVGCDVQGAKGEGHSGLVGAQGKHRRRTRDAGYRAGLRRQRRSQSDADRLAAELPVVAASMDSHAEHLICGSVDMLSVVRDMQCWDEYKAYENHDISLEALGRENRHTSIDDSGSVRRSAFGWSLSTGRTRAKSYSMEPR